VHPTRGEDGDQTNEAAGGTADVASDQMLPAAPKGATTPPTIPNGAAPAVPRDPSTPTSGSGIEGQTGRLEVAVAVGLGWQMAELYRAPVALGPQPPNDPSGRRLPGLSSLPSRQRLLLGLNQIDIGLDTLAASFGFCWTASIQPPTTAAARAKLDACSISGAKQAARMEFLAALVDLHIALLTGLTASDYQIGKAYGLGRALADTCRPRQADTDLLDSFRPGRIQELSAWLVDLTSVLPSHAGHSVTQSLAWWTQEISAAADPEAADQQWKQATQEVRYQAAPVTRPAGGHTGRPMKNEVSNTRPTPKPLHDYALAAHRQGQLWRSLLTGEKHASDLLAPNDYVDAGQRLVRAAIPIAKRAAATLKWVIAALVVAAAGVVMLAVFVGSGSVGARLLAILTAVGGTFAGTWRLISPRVARVTSAMEKQLWGAELSAAVAEALTLPPVGQGEPAGLVLVAEDVVSAAIRRLTASTADAPTPVSDAPIPTAAASTTAAPAAPPPPPQTSDPPTPTDGAPG
jgi:hypothetical protein